MSIENYIGTLPKSANVESRLLEMALDFKNFSTSYKALWFNSIFEEVIKGNKEIEIKKIISKMVSYAWYPAIYYKLSLGFQDQMGKIAHYVHENLGVSREERADKIEYYVFSSNDKELNKMLNNISKYVPYRLIRPFFEEKIKLREKLLNRKLTDLEINRMIADLSIVDDEALYKIDVARKVVLVNDKWCEYLVRNQAIIQGWIKYKITYYLQMKNPNVPAIPFKVTMPTKRDLSRAKFFWKVVKDNIDVNDIYTGMSFNIENISRYGEISIDHYVPWSFVLHDELWNLTPTFKNINSSKGNNLPSSNEYLNEFCELQYKAFLVGREGKKISQRLLEDYFNINREIYKINSHSDRSKALFIGSLKNTIEPLCRIAYNQGYSSWKYDN